MRTLRLVVIAAVLSPAVGCKWLDDMKGKGDADQVRGRGPLPAVTPDQLVKYLNDRAAHLQSIEYDKTRMRVSGGGVRVPVTFDGNLACAQPRNFRMVSTGRMVSATVDMGSNRDEFWVYVAAPGESPLYVYASHADFEAGRAKMPGGIPFEPDWVMQALGMTTLPPPATPMSAQPTARRSARATAGDRPAEVAGPGNQYTVKVNDQQRPSERSYTLSWVTMTPTGQPVRKEVVFDGDSATGTRPQVKRHLLKDEKSGKLIASAEIRAAQTIQVGQDALKPVVVQYPTHVVLRWEEQKFEMDLTLEKAQVNHPLADDPTRRDLFARPQIRGASPIDLAKYEFGPAR